MCAIGEFAHDLPFADFDSPAFARCAEEHTPARIAQIGREEGAARDCDALRDAILGLKVHDWTVRDVAAAAAHLIRPYNGQCKLKIFQKVCA